MLHKKLGKLIICLNDYIKLLDKKTKAVIITVIRVEMHW